jgi:hypothetical protein
VIFVKHLKINDPKARREDLFVGSSIIPTFVPVPRVGGCFEEREELNLKAEDEVAGHSKGI